MLRCRGLDCLRLRFRGFGFSFFPGAIERRSSWLAALRAAISSRAASRLSGSSRFSWMAGWFEELGMSSLDWSFASSTVESTGVPSSMALEPDGMVGAAVPLSSIAVSISSVDRCCRINRPDLVRVKVGDAAFSASFAAAGPLPLEALVIWVELISICATVAFADEGERRPIFVKGLTWFRCALDTSVNPPVSLMRLGYYLLCRPRLA